MNGLIPFNAWSKERIEMGFKTCTSRHKRYPKDKRVTHITPKLSWWFIKQYLWKPEGANSPEELQEVIEDIYKRKVSGEEQFYVHFGNFKEKIEHVCKKFKKVPVPSTFELTIKEQCIECGVAR